MDNNSQPNIEPEIAPEPIQQSIPTPPSPETPPTTPFEPEKPVKKSKKKLMIIMIVIALLLISGGAASAILLLPKKTAAPSSTGSPANTITDAGDIKDKTEWPRYKDSLLGFSIESPRSHIVRQLSYGASEEFNIRLSTDDQAEGEGEIDIVILRGGEQSDVPLSEINSFNAKVLGYVVTDATSITSETSENMTINGVDTVRFIGRIHYFNSFNNKEFDDYVMGYSFYVEGIPVQLIGFSSDLSSNQEIEDAIIKEVDTMMQTINISES